MEKQDIKNTVSGVPTAVLGGFLILIFFAKPCISTPYTGSTVICNAKSTE